MQKSGRLGFAFQMSWSQDTCSINFCVSGTWTSAECAGAGSQPSDGPRRARPTKANCSVEKGTQETSFGFHPWPVVTQLWVRGTKDRSYNFSEPHCCQHINKMGFSLGFGTG